MADGFEFKVVTAPFNTWAADRDRRMKRAAMWTVREAGRFVKREARAKAPVLSDGSAVKYRAWRQGGGAGSGPVAGLLRNSITPSRRLQTFGGSYALKVGPRGQRVHLYAGKEEEREGYMAAGYDAVAASMAAIAEYAYWKVWGS